MPDKVSGTHVYMQHVRVPGMLHGRVVRPRGQRAYGAARRSSSVDEASIRGIPGARVVRRGDFLGVVAENEWDAVRAARQLKVTWETHAGAAGQREASTSRCARRRRRRRSSLRARRRRRRARLGARTSCRRSARAPYQAHAPFGPNCAVADVKPDSALVMCSTQDIYATRRTLAALLKLPAEKVRVQYYEGSGTYGHSCYDDVAQAAAFMSQDAGKPVRVQFMRWDEHGWDNYGPAHVGEVRAAADADGKIVAYEYHGWQHNWSARKPRRSSRARRRPSAMAARRMGVAGREPPDVRRRCTRFPT